MRKSIFDYPAIPMSIVAGLVLALLVAGGIVFENRFLQHRLHGNESANQVVETMLTVLSAFYGILLGLLVVGAYENMNSMDDVVSNEASAISVLYWNAEEFPEPVRGQLEDGLRAYAQEVADRSFDQKVPGVKPTTIEMSLMHGIFDTLNGFEPGTPREVALQSEARRQLSDLQEARNSRISSSDTGIPGVLWWIVGLGAAITLILICLMDFPVRTHLMFGCVLAFFIGAMIYVIAEMDNPFSGADRVGPEMIQELLDAAPARR